jgi:hypothetical protein
MGFPCYTPSCMGRSGYVSGRARDLWRKLLGADPLYLTYWAAMGALVWLGVVLRARGMWFGRPISLWEDEASWAIRLIDRPPSDNVMRSMGFMALTKGLVALFSASERVLRFLPWCAGTGAVLVTPLVAMRLHRSSAAQLLLVAILALHPSAIDLSKEFKPYSVALLIHLLLMLFVLRYLDERRERDLLAAIAVAFFGVLFSQDVVFAYPMVFGLMAFKAYRSNDRGHLRIVFVGASFALGLLLTLFRSAPTQLGDTLERTQYWGTKYNVFYVQAGGQGSMPSWIAARLADLAGMLGNRRELWHWSAVSPETLSSLKHAEASLWVLLCVAGVAVLAYRKRFWHLTLLLAPPLVMAGFNYFGFWPLGAFRTNLFALPYFAGLAAAVFDSSFGEGVAIWNLLPAALLVMLPFFTLGRSNHSRKESGTANAVYEQASQDLLQLQGSKNRRSELVLDAASCAPWRYYAHYHPSRRETKLAARFTPHCRKTSEAMVKAAHELLTTSKSRVFLLAAGDEEMAGLQERMPNALHVVVKQLVGRNDALILEVELARQ